MLRDNKHKNSKEHIKAILGEGTSFWGSLKFNGTVRIDGFFEGDIVTNDILIIGETGVVKGRIEAGSVFIHGSIIGEIKAKKNVSVMSTAQIIGDILSPMLKVDEGVKLLGNCTIGQDVIKEEKSKFLPLTESAKS